MPNQLSARPSPITGNVASDVISDTPLVLPPNTPAVPETADAPTPSRQPIDLPKDEARFQVSILDYFRTLGVPDQEATPLLGEILDKAKKRCEAILFFLSFTGAWERLADWLTLAIRDAALEAYIWNQRDRFIQRFAKNRRYRQDADDIAHNVISKAVVAIRRGRRPKNKLKHWLSVIARNTLIDHHRIEIGQPQTNCLLQAGDGTDDRPLLHKLPDPAPSPSDQAACRLTWEELAASHSKQVADAYRYAAEGYTQKEIAELCGTSDRTIRRWLAEVTSTLQKRLKKTG